MGDHGGDGGVTHSGLRYRLPSPTSLVVEEDEVIMNNKFSILSSSVMVPLIWDMAEGFGAMKAPLTLLECSGHHQVRGLHSGV